MLGDFAAVPGHRHGCAGRNTRISTHAYGEMFFERRDGISILGPVTSSAVPSTRKLKVSRSLARPRLRRLDHKPSRSRQKSVSHSSIALKIPPRGDRIAASSSLSRSEMMLLWLPDGHFEDCRGAF